MPKPAATVEVGALRVGMFVHLDTGWTAHPFPLSSFRITDEAQIQAIHALGVSRLRWSPQRSDPAGAATDAAADDAAGAAGAAHVRDAMGDATADAAQAERAAVLRCQRQVQEATRDWQVAIEQVRAAPAAARERIEALSAALCDKMLDAGALCVRALSEQAGEAAGAHALNVAIVAMLLGRACGLVRDELRELGMGALLHDLGHLDLPPHAWHADERCAPADWALYREHVERGLALGHALGLTATALEVIAQHHECADGSGFPHRLGLDAQARAARIVALADRYDRLCNAPPPAPSLTPHEALSLLFAQGRHRHDPMLLGRFIRLMGVYPPGSVVQLTDDRFALVTRVDPARPLRPRVQVHDPDAAAGASRLLDLDAPGMPGIRRSLRPAQLPPATLQSLSPLTRVAYFFEPAPVHPDAGLEP